jgi:hypothetical protein
VQLPNGFAEHVETMLAEFVERGIERRRSRT